VSPGSFDGVRDGRYRRDLAVGRGTGEGPLTTEPQTVRAGTEDGWNPVGYDSLDDLLAATITDSMSPVICMNDGCDYTVEMEPDQNVGCGTSRL